MSVKISEKRVKFASRVTKGEGGGSGPPSRRRDEGEGVKIAKFTVAYIIVAPKGCERKYHFLSI